MSAQVLPLSCDWLALTLNLDSVPVGCPPGHCWAYYSSTSVWGSRWCLFNEWGEKVFTLLFRPLSPIIKPTAALFEVANEWLYHGLGIQGALDLLSSVVRFSVRGISRLDLAVDFVPDASQTGIIRGLASGTHYVSGKRNGSGFWSVNNDEYFPPEWRGRIPHCQSWGHKTSDIKWKLYYKTKELRDAAGGKGFDKPYIVDMWRDVGLDEHSVWRLEVSVRNCNGFDFLGKRLTFDAFKESGSDLFQALYTSRFQVCLNQGHKDRTNDTRVKFLDVGTARDAFKVHRNETLVEHNGRLALIRHLVADVQREEVIINDTAREAVIAAMESILEGDRFHKYFHAVVGMEFDEWVEWLRVRAYYWGEEYKETRGKVESDSGNLEMALLDANLAWRPQLESLSVPHPPKSQGRQLRIGDVV